MSDSTVAGGDEDVLGIVVGRGVAGDKHHAALVDLIEAFQYTDFDARRLRSIVELDSVADIDVHFLALASVVCDVIELAVAGRRDDIQKAIRC